MTQAPPPAGLTGRALGELRQALMMFLYLYVLLGLFVLNEVVILKQHDMMITLNGFALLNALVLAKIMLVVEHLRLTRWLDRRPLIYPIIFDAALLTLLFFLFHVLERVAIGMWHGARLVDSLPVVGGGGIAGVVCVALILFISLLPYFAFKHLAGAIGIARVKTMLFSSSAAGSG